MDFRGMGFGGDSNLAIVLGIAAVWLVVFVFVRSRKELTGQDGDVGAITFGIVVNVVFGMFMAVAAFVPAWLVSSILIIGYAAATDQTAADLVPAHWWLLGIASVIAGGFILRWLRLNGGTV